MSRLNTIVSTLLLALAPQAQAQTFQPPIMGWSSWNTYHVNISDSLIRSQADALVRLGLNAYGYDHINIDDGFFGFRDSTGLMHPHPERFPNGMKAVADYIHSLDLKAGLYSDAGANTCGSRYDDDENGFGAGFYGHEHQDARLYFHDWGFDFIKIDYCGAGTWLDLEERERYTAICDAIRAEASRPVSINLCRWAFPGTWAADIATSWRISSDIRPRWRSIKNIIEKNLYLSAYCHDGHYNDMDMLELGRGLSASEEEVHMGMWCMMSSPLLIGCNLNKLSPATLALLTNRDLIAINQDPLGLQAYVACRHDSAYVLVKDVKERRGLTRAVALYNPSDTEVEFSINPERLELAGEISVKAVLGDLAAGADGHSGPSLRGSSIEPAPLADGTPLETSVAPHGIKVFLLAGTRRLEPTLYEAEWASMPLFNDLGRRKLPPSYVEIEGASGGAGLKNVGGSEENVARWTDVWSDEGGLYTLTVNYIHSPRLNIYVKVNGAPVGHHPTGTAASVGAKGDHSGSPLQGGPEPDIRSASFNITLRPGFNTIEIGSPLTLVPPLDCLLLQKRSGVEVEGLTVEGLTEPLGLDEPSPRLGWQIKSDSCDVLQTAYRLIISSTRSRAEALDGDVWDSGEVPGQASQWVSVPSYSRGDPLWSPEPNREYFWRVKITTNKGPSLWSAVSRWQTGMMQSPWKGCWIGTDSLFPGDSMEKHSRLASRYLRKAFSLQGEVRKATAHVCGLGLYKLELNGSKVGQAELSPLSTQYNKTLLYDTYDLTPLLREDNVVLLTLGAGNFFAPRQNYQTNVRRTFGMPRAIMNLIVEYADGRQDTIATDTSWLLTADGPVRYSNLYDGELFDASKTFHGVFSPDYDASAWMPASEMTPPGGKLVGVVCPPITVYASNMPEAIIRLAQDKFILDYGTNGAGRLRLDASGLTPADTLHFRFAEMLDDSGRSLYTKNLRSALSADTYIGGANGEWTTEFTYHGFRYVEVSGLDSLAASSIKRELLADQMADDDTDLYVEADGSPSILNDILAAARRGIRSNYKGMPLDCPQRDERMPWLGDRTVGCLGESYMMDCRALYSKWMQDISDAQRSDGNISDVSPAYWSLFTNNITWPAALPFGLDMLHRQYGDLRPMQRHYQSVKRFLAYMKRKFQQDGLITRDKYGDWCLPPEDLGLIHSKDSARMTPGAYLSSAYYMYICRLMARYARMFHETEGDAFASDAAFFEAEAQTTLDAINSHFYTSPDGYAGGTLTAGLLALQMGIAPEERCDSIKENILRRIHRDNCHVSCGVIGIGWLMRCLSDIGSGDLAYRIATQTSYPGYGYMLLNGATTIWELWNGNTADPSMNSANHVMLLGDLVTWAYEYLGGIRPAAPGFSHIDLEPDFSIGDVDLVRASHPTPYGVVRSQWKRSAEGMKWSVEVPANTQATIHLPSGETREIGSGCHCFSFSN